MRVDQNLRIVAVETVDADLREAAVLAVVLDAHPGLERKALRQTRGIGPLEQFGVGTLTSAGASRRSVAERLAETTTSSIEMPFCATSKFSSSVSPRFSATEVFRGVARARGLRASAPFGEVFRK